MNSFQRWLNNPNAHLALGFLSFAATFFPQAAPFVPILNSITGVTAATGMLLPETRTVLPETPAVLTRSMHAEDYAAVVAQVVNALKNPPDVNAPGRH